MAVQPEWSLPEQEPAQTQSVEPGEAGLRLSDCDGWSAMLQPYVPFEPPSGWTELPGRDVILHLDCDRFGYGSIERPATVYLFLWQPGIPPDACPASGDSVRILDRIYVEDPEIYAAMVDESPYPVNLTTMWSNTPGTLWTYYFIGADYLFNFPYVAQVDSLRPPDWSARDMSEQWYWYDADGNGWTSHWEVRFDGQTGESTLEGRYSGPDPLYVEAANAATQSWPGGTATKVQHGMVGGDAPSHAGACL